VIDYYRQKGLLKEINGEDRSMVDCLARPACGYRRSARMRALALGLICWYVGELLFAHEQ